MKCWLTCLRSFAYYVYTTDNDSLNQADINTRFPAFHLHCRKQLSTPCCLDMLSHTMLVLPTTALHMMTSHARLLRHIFLHSGLYYTEWLFTSGLLRHTFLHYAALLLKWRVNFQSRAAETSCLVLCLYYEAWLSTPGLLRHSDPYYACHHEGWLSTPWLLRPPFPYYALYCKGWLSKPWLPKDAFFFLVSVTLRDFLIGFS